ncbi:MAG: preprotein translocase subunit SecG [Clostridia bacterium]|nr:preprotein translocase subunit SecG [Clostridia bacterium]
MSTFLTVVFVLACIVLIISILMQSGSRAGLSGSIGGGAEQIWGKQKGRTYDELFDKITKVAAIAFIICAIALVYLQ